MKTKHDWTRAEAVTGTQRHVAAMSDPDALPLTAEWLAGMMPTSRLKILRCALGLAQQQFATRFQIPLGASQPDQTARAYLRAIAGNAGLFTKHLRRSHSLVSRSIFVVCCLMISTHHCC
jgi:putative transcriptional regulator